jgi:hypothetical protein
VASGRTAGLAGAVEHDLTGPLDADDLAVVRAALLRTGLTREPVLVTADVTAVVWLLVHADDERDAAQAACRIVEVAHRDAGHGRLGVRLRRTAMPYQRASL